MQAVADVILIMCALFAWVAFGFIAYTAWVVIQLVKQVKGEVGVLTGAAEDSLQEARATGKFVTGAIVKPASVAFGYATAVKATLRSLSEDVSRKSKP